MADAKLDITAARAICEAATPGPWRWGDWRAEFGLIESEFRLTLERNRLHGSAAHAVRRDRDDDCVRVLKVEDEIAPSDAAFISAAREGWTVALDECERLRAEVAKFREQLAIARDDLTPRRPADPRVKSALDIIDALLWETP